VKVHDHRMKNVSFGYGVSTEACYNARWTLRRDVLLVVCRVPCVKVVGATLSEGFLVFLHGSMQ